MAKKTKEPLFEMTAAETARPSQWDPEIYEKGALIAAVLSVGLMMILYIRSLFTTTVWGGLSVGAVALLVVAWFWAERSVAARVLVRFATWLVGFVAIAYAAVMSVLMAWEFWGFITGREIMEWISSQLIYAAAVLLFAAVPLAKTAAAAHKAMDIWCLRIFATLGALMLIVSCIYGGLIEWGFDNVYFKLFTCLIAALAAAFPWMIKPEKRDQATK